MKLACIGPLSPSRTGIAAFSEKLLPYLAQGSEIKLFTDNVKSLAAPVTHEFECANISRFFAEFSRFDSVLYHMGNHYKFHRRVFETLCRVPGVVLLHDCVLNQFFARYCLASGNFALFRKLFAISYGNDVDAEVHRFCRAMGDPYRFPMAGPVALLSLGVIVMSEYGRGIVENEAAAADVRKVNFPYFPTEREPSAPHALRDKFGIPEDCFVLSFIGHITPAKRIPAALNAFRKLKEKFPNAVFLLAGEESSGLRIKDLLRNDVTGGVRYLGYLDEQRLHELAEITDVCINLRYPSNGEMSSTLIDMLGRGKVASVSDYAQFAEFPDSICVKITAGPNESDELAKKLLELAGNPARLISMGAAAKDYIAREHSASEAGKVILEYLEERSSKTPVLRGRNRDELLGQEPAVKRMRQMVSYRTRRLASYIQEQGMAGTFREALRRATSAR